jgi:hypothetical protein
LAVIGIFGASHLPYPDPNFLCTLDVNAICQASNL